MTPSTPAEAISVLRSADWSEVAIGRAVGATQSTINRIGRGKTEPSFTTGKALIDLATAVQATGLTPGEHAASREVEAANEEGDAASANGDPVPELKAA